MKTAIFDMDGTVLDSMNEWRSLNVLYAQKQGIALTPSVCAELRQLSGMQTAIYFQTHFHLDVEFETLLAHAADAMQGYYEKGLPEKPGAKAYLRRLGERGVQRVLATATPTALAQLALEKSGLAPLFDQVLTTRIIGIEKDDPAFWLEVARRAGARADECTVYEDALYAIKGALKAGMPVIGIEDDTNAAVRADMRALCRRVIAHYDELP